MCFGGKKREAVSVQRISQTSGPNLTCQSVLIQFFFFLKNVETILSSQATKKTGNGSDLFHGPYSADPYCRVILAKFCYCILTVFLLGTSFSCNSYRLVIRSRSLISSGLIFSPQILYKHHATRGSPHSVLSHPRR